jgi:hypothetical protein
METFLYPSGFDFLRRMFRVFVDLETKIDRSQTGVVYFYRVNIIPVFDIDNSSV